MAETVAMNVLYATELTRLADALAAAGVQVYALRGAARLAEDFETAAERQMLDMDLLVRPACFRIARHVLAHERWRPLPGGEYCFYKNSPPRYADIHTQLRGLPRRMQAEILDRFRPARDIPHVLVPQPEDAVLLDAVHAVVDHGWLDPKWLRDAADTITAAENFDWPLLAVRARRAGVAAAVEVFVTAVVASEGVRAPRGLFAGSGFRAGVVRKFLAAGRPVVDRGHVMRLLFCSGPLDLLFAAGRMLFPGLDFIRRRYGLRTKRDAFGPALVRPLSVIRKTFAQWRTPF